MNKIFAILLATSLVGGVGYAKNMDNPQNETESNICINEDSYYHNHMHRDCENHMADYCDETYKSEGYQACKDFMNENYMDMQTCKHYTNKNSYDTCHRVGKEKRNKNHHHMSKKFSNRNDEFKKHMR